MAAEGKTQSPSYEETQRFRGPWYAAPKFSEARFHQLWAGCLLTASWLDRDPGSAGWLYLGLLAILWSWLLFDAAWDARRWRGTQLVVRCVEDRLEAVFGPPPGETFTVPYDEIQACEVVRYHAWNRFGYGKRCHGNKTFLTLSGKWAVKVTLTGVKKYVLGSQRPEELAHAISEAAGLSDSPVPEGVPGETSVS